MDWLTIKTFIYAWEPFAALFFACFAFLAGLFGGKLQQKYKEGAIKGEIDTKFANAGRRIEDLIAQLETVENSLDDLWGRFKACQLVQSERVETRRLATQSFIRDTIDKEFAQLKEQLAKYREDARNEKRNELEELKQLLVDKEKKSKWTFLKRLWPRWT